MFTWVRSQSTRHRELSPASPAICSSSSCPSSDATGAPRLRRSSGNTLACGAGTWRRGGSQSTLPFGLATGDIFFRIRCSFMGKIKTCRGLLLVRLRQIWAAGGSRKPRLPRLPRFFGLGLLASRVSSASSWGTASELVALEAVPGGSDPIQVEVVPAGVILGLDVRLRRGLQEHASGRSRSKKCRGAQFLGCSPTSADLGLDPSCICCDTSSSIRASCRLQ